LHTRGAFFDRIKTIVEFNTYTTPRLAELQDIPDKPGKQASLTDKGKQHIREIRAWEMERLSLTLSLQPYPTGEDIIDVYWRTMVANSTGGADITGQGEQSVPPADWRNKWKLLHQRICTLPDVVDNNLSPYYSSSCQDWSESCSALRNILLLDLSY
jgi:hypothetical protein